MQILNKIKFYEDPTNKNDIFLRTRIRLILEKNQKLKYNLSKSIDLFCILKKYFEAHVINFFKEQCAVKK